MRYAKRHKILWIKWEKTVCEVNQILDLIDINFKVVIINVFKEQIVSPKGAKKGVVVVCLIDNINRASWS